MLEIKRILTLGVGNPFALQLSVRVEPFITVRSLGLSSISNVGLTEIYSTNGNAINT